MKPVTIVTGYLGSGKTTIINEILKTNKTYKIAIIENELGEIPVDGEFIQTDESKIFIINDCCLCCSYRGDLIEALKNINNYNDKFDYVIIETTGVADPSPIATTFFMNSEIKNDFSLNGIVSLVDTKNVLRHLFVTPEIKKQIAFADLIILTKTDISSDTEIANTIDEIKKINPLTDIIDKNKDNYLEHILSLQSNREKYFDKLLTLEKFYFFGNSFVYDLSNGNYILNFNVDNETIEQIFITKYIPENIVNIENHVNSEFKQPIENYLFDNNIIELNKIQNLYLNGNNSFSFEIKENDKYIIFTKYSQSLPLVDDKNNKRIPLLHKKYKLSGEHEEEIVTINYTNDAKLNLDKFNFFLSVLLPRYGANLYRYKGILYPDDKNKIFINGVHEIFDYEIKPLLPNEKAVNRLVFIGKNITKDITLRGIDSCFG